ncbi:TerC family protein [Shewanella sp. SNU WT4]|uniref:TerC family protein n=1 Tax=Shewanella sp. SNU WT4 TaxID=2590015 RepID=UPI0023F4402A|nr:TerC family protein [Shewanella sp. SNU WT4]
MEPILYSPATLWLTFAAIITALLWIDLKFVGGGKSHVVSIKEAGIWSIIWVSISMLFAVVIWFYYQHQAGDVIAHQKSMEFITGYVLEKALAVDNVFVWLMIFSYFAVPAELQRRVLLYGVLGAIVLRTIMVFAGSYLINQFHWILYVFGAFLLVSGIKMLFSHDDDEGKPKRLLEWIKSRMRVTDTLEGEQFWVVKQGIRYATPLLLVLILVEISDIIFAVDSIPAIFAVTTDPFIVLTSNIFAIMGLRAMFFLLAGVADRFALLKYGLAAILVFIGVKMLIIEYYHISIGVSLAVIATILSASMAASWLFSRNAAHKPLSDQPLREKP